MVDHHGFDEHLCTDGAQFLVMLGIIRSEIVNDALLRNASLDQ